MNGPVGIEIGDIVPDDMTDVSVGFVQCPLKALRFTGQDAAKVEFIQGKQPLTRQIPERDADKLLRRFPEPLAVGIVGIAAA